MNKKSLHVALAASVALLAVSPAVAATMEPAAQAFADDWLRI